MRLPARILIAYDYFPPIAEDLKKAFERLNISVEIFYSADYEHWFYKKIIRRINKLARNLRLIRKDVDLFSQHRLNRLNYLGANLQQACEVYLPDMIFFIHGQPYGNSYLNNMSIPKLGWWIEPNDDIVELRKNAAPFDIYYSFSQITLDLLKQEDFRVEYLCHSVNPQRFYPISKLLKTYDVCFVGNWSPWREKVLEVVLKLTNNIALYGPNWKKKSKIIANKLNMIHRGDSIIGDDLNVLFNSSKVVLNASRIPNSGGLNMRFFEVLATKSCFLSDATLELAQHFDSGRHLMIFDDLSDLQSKLILLLSDGDLSENLASCGYLHVLKSYTYDQMAQKLLLGYESISSERG